MKLTDKPIKLKLRKRALVKGFPAMGCIFSLESDGATLVAAAVSPGMTPDLVENYYVQVGTGMCPYFFLPRDQVTVLAKNA